MSQIEHLLEPSSSSALYEDLDFEMIWYPKPESKQLQHILLEPMALF